MQPSSEIDAIQRLLEVTRSITGVLDLDRLLQKILNSAVEVLGAERGYLVLLDVDEHKPLEQRLRVKASFQMDPDEMTTAKFKASRTAILKCLETRQSHRTDNALAEPDPSRSVELFGLRSILCEPLIAKEKLLGALYLDSRVTARFSPWARQLLPSLASQAAICIENANLVAEREEIMRRQHQDNLRATEMETWKNAMAAFLSIASHDLKGPLTVLQNGVGILNRLKLPDPAPELVEDMRVSLQRARRLVETYLDAAAVQEGRTLSLKRGGVPLHPLVEAELQQARTHLHPERREVFHFVNAVPAEVSVLADSERLVQVLGNLIENAVKYARKGRIEVRARREGPEVVVEVCDQGPGISEQAKAHLFERYFRAEPGTARGTGLGLWIVRQLVETHGGSIEVESQQGQGSIFRFRLPAAETLRVTLTGD